MDVLIFVFGLLVTVVTIGAVGTIWWAAVRDPQRDGTYAHHHDDEPPLRRVA